MYAPAQFREDRPDILAEAIRTIQLASLVTATPDGYLASHVPMVLKEEAGELVLEAHVARPNAHWKAALGAGAPSLAIFQGPQAYVSPGWYESKRQHGKVVPTWNYIAVHAEGRLEAVEDGAWLRDHLEDLTRLNEAGREAPWAMADAPGDFIRNLSRGIVGLRLRECRLAGTWKLIQHRQEGDRLGTIAGLAASPGPGSAAVAEAMRELEAARAGS